MTDSTPTPLLHRPERVPFDVRAQPALRRALGMWHVAVMQMDTLEPQVVEAIRLRAARYHDCHT
jgi:alkylhydroperoxidase family enzyme